MITNNGISGGVELPVTNTMVTQMSIKISISPQIYTKDEIFLDFRGLSTAVYEE